MPRRSDNAEKVLGPLEAEVMRIIWATAGPVRVRDLLERINRKRKEPLAYTTVMTVMSRLVDKDVLSRRLEGRGYVYEATAADAAAIAVRGIVREFGDAAMAHFVDEARTDPKLMRRLQELLSEES